MGDYTVLDTRRQAEVRKKYEKDENYVDSVCEKKRSMFKVRELFGCSVYMYVVQHVRKAMRAQKDAKGLKHCNNKYVEMPSSRFFAKLGLLLHG